MINQEKEKSVDRIVLEKIRKGEAKMRPKTYFILKWVLLILSIFVVVLFVLYLISFIVFILRASGVWFLPGFGFRGIGVLFFSLPWALILIAAGLMAVLEIFVKKFDFGWRQPIVYSLLAIIVFVLLGSLILGKTRLHSEFFQRAQEHRLPIMGNFYRGFGMPKPDNMHMGVVSEITDYGFIIETRNGDVLTVVINADTGFYSEKDIGQDDTVVVLGKRHNSTIQAVDVRKINGGLKFLPRFPRPKPSGKIR